MSHVTDIIVIDSGFNYQEHFKKIKKWLQGRYDTCSLYHVAGRAGGNKVMQCDVLMGAFNYMNVDEFITYLNSLNWDNLYGIQLLIKDEHDERFSFWECKLGKLASK